jgi:hypothetical protein
MAMKRSQAIADSVRTLVVRQVTVGGFRKKRKKGFSVETRTGKGNYSSVLIILLVIPIS